MAVHVRAFVVDIKNDTPTDEDSFLVDTNAWYWLHYPKASQDAKQYQTVEYPNFLKRCLESNSKLLCSPLSFSELAHRIEDVEKKIYAYNADKAIGTKQFRHDYPGQRRRVTGLIQSIWLDVVEMSQIMPINLDENFVATSVDKFGAVELDGYDLYMAENAVKSGVLNVITDDADYCTFPGITVFTANETAIRLAGNAGRLLRR